MSFRVRPGGSVFLRPDTRAARLKLARAFEVYDQILSADLEGSIHARRLDPEQEHPEFTITLSLVDRTQEQLGALAIIVERYDLELDVDDHRLASLR